MTKAQWLKIFKAVKKDIRKKGSSKLTLYFSFDGCEILKKYLDIHNIKESK